MPNPAAKHWCEGVHLPEDGWVYAGSYELPSGQKGDAYYHERIESYAGISIQYGPEESQYYSSGSIYLDDVTLTPQSSMLTAYAMACDRGTLRHNTPNTQSRFKHLSLLPNKK